MFTQNMKKNQINKVALENRFIQMTVMDAYPFFQPFLLRETTFVTSCCQTSISKVGAALKREFSPTVQILSFLSESLLERSEIGKSCFPLTH